jgi:hypothetical protein
VSAAGELALWAALLCAAWGAAAGTIAARRADSAFALSADRALVAVAALLALAVAGAVAIEFAPDLNFALAANTTSTNLPRPLRLAALLSTPAVCTLIVAALVAALAVNAPGAERAKWSGTVCAALAAIVALAVLAGRPYERYDVAVADGRGLDPAWYSPWSSIARVALVIFAAAAATAMLRAAARMRSRGWALAAVAFGAIAIACALRRSLGGPAWGAIEWAAVAAWAACVVLARPWRGAARALAIAGAVAAIAALLGGSASHWASLELQDAVPATQRDRLGTTWTFVSDGRSIYTQLDRRVLASFIETGPGRGARPEWRVYVDAVGETRSEAPVDAVVAGIPTYVVLGFLSPPGANSAAVRVRFVPLFALWWVAAILLSATAVVGARQERST